VVPYLQVTPTQTGVLVRGIRVLHQQVVVFRKLPIDCQRFVFTEQGFSLREYLIIALYQIQPEKVGIDEFYLLPMILRLL
jgi:hypothetical protein